MNKDKNEITITEEESKVCLLDNKSFPTSREMMWHVKKSYNLNFEQYILKAYYNDIRPVCLKTGKPLSFKAHKLGPWFKNYSKNCFPRKPHTEETKNKIKSGCEKTNLEKFGVKNVYSTDWCKEKIKKTNLERYGVENPMKSNKFKRFEKRTPESLQKAKETNQHKYGTDWFTGTKEFIIKRKKTWLEKYGSECPMDNPEIKEKVSKKVRKHMIENFGKIKSNKLNTKPEIEFREFLKRINVEYDFQKPYNDIGVIDYYLPQYDMWIEVDGKYWHPEVKESLNFQQLHNSSHDKIKNDNIPSLCRLREDDIVKLIYVEDIKKHSYTPQFNIPYEQIIMEKDYFFYLIRKFGTIGLEKQIPKVLKFIRIYQPEFPYPPSDENLSDVIKTISEYDTSKVMNDGDFSNECWSYGNIHLKSKFKSFWKSSFKGNPSPYKAWNDDKLMKEIIAYRIGCNETGEVFDLSLKEIVKGMSARRITVSFFKPILASAIYKHYLGESLTPTVLDPCCGFGGRLLGFKSKYPNGTYIGCEPNIETYNELIDLVKDSGWDNVHIYNCKFEDYQGTKDVDLTFTSIPYYDLEEYSNNSEYKTFNEWRDTFIKAIESCKNCYINTSIGVGSKLGWGNIDRYLLNHRTHFDKGNGHKKEGIFKVS